MQQIAKIVLSLFLFQFLLMTRASAQYQEYDSLTYISERGDSLQYRQLNPLKIELGEKYPLVLFLHGAGERGSDNISR